MSKEADMAQIFVDELLNDLKDMIDYYDGDVPTWDYRPEAQRRVEKYVRDWDHLMRFGDDIRGRAF